MEGHGLQSLNRLQPQMKKKWALIKVQHFEILESREMKDIENWKRASRLRQNNMEDGEKPQVLVTLLFQPRELRSHFSY